MIGGDICDVNAEHGKVIAGMLFFLIITPLPSPLTPILPLRPHLLFSAKFYIRHSQIRPLLTRAPFYKGMKR